MHAHRVVQGSIPVSQKFTARVFEFISIPPEPGTRTAVFRSECNVKSSRLAYPLQPPSGSANTVHKMKSVAARNAIFVLMFIATFFCLYYRVLSTVPVCDINFETP